MESYLTSPSFPVDPPKSTSQTSLTPELCSWLGIKHPKLHPLDYAAYDCARVIKLHEEDAQMPAAEYKKLSLGLRLFGYETQVVIFSWFALSP